MAGPRLRLRLHDRILETVDRPLVMGILNVTPDSFSDGGRHLAVEAALRHAARLVDEGADLLDVGGESTRPGAAPVRPEEEQARILPVLEGLQDAGLDVPVSVDTRHATTAAAALDRGAHLVNDVTALADPGMAPLVAERGVPVVLMHMKGTPVTMQDDPRYEDVLREVTSALREHVARAEAAGIRKEAIVLDPGLGFGKRTGKGVEDNCAVLSGLPRLATLGHPLLVGASRKRFIGNISGAAVEERLPGSLTAAVAATWGGAAILRVHDVGATVQAVAVAARLDPTDWATFWVG